MKTKVNQAKYLEKESKELVNLGKGRIEAMEKYNLLDLLLTPKSIETLSNEDLEILHELAAKSMHICGDIDGKFGIVALTTKIDDPTRKTKLTREEMLADINGILRSKREANHNLSYTNISDAKFMQVSQDTERFKAREGNFKIDIAKDDDPLKKYQATAKEIKQLAQKMAESKKLFSIKKYTCDIIDVIDGPNNQDLPLLFKELEKEVCKKATAEFKQQLELQKDAIENISSVQLNEFKMIIGDQLANTAKIDLATALDNSRKEVFKKIILQELKEQDPIKESMKKYVEAVIAATKFTDKDLSIKEVSRLNEEMANQYSYLDPLENANRAKVSTKAIVNAAGEKEYGQLRYHVGQTVKWVFGKSDSQQIDKIFTEVFPVAKKTGIVQIITDTATAVKDGILALKPSFAAKEKDRQKVDKKIKR